jgi:hypothetical protein
MSVEEAIKKLKGFLGYKNNWDQQGAKAPSPDSVHHAISFMLERDDDPYLVGLTVSGHAFVEYIQDNGIDSDNFIFNDVGKIKYNVIQRRNEKFKEI